MAGRPRRIARDRCRAASCAHEGGGHHGVAAHGGVALAPGAVAAAQRARSVGAHRPCAPCEGMALPRPDGGVRQRAIDGDPGMGQLAHAAIEPADRRASGACGPDGAPARARAARGNLTAAAGWHGGADRAAPGAAGAARAERRADHGDRARRRGARRRAARLDLRHQRRAYRALCVRERRSSDPARGQHGAGFGARGGGVLHLPGAQRNDVIQAPACTHRSARTGRGHGTERHRAAAVLRTGASVRPSPTRRRVPRCSG